MSRPRFSYPPLELFRNSFTRCDYGNHWSDITRFSSRRPERDEFLTGLRALFTWYKRDVAWIVFHDLRKARESGARPLLLDPRYDPSHELSVEYRLPEAKLNAWLRAISGHSAREWWDNWRAHDPACGLLARLRDEIEPLFRAHRFTDLPQRLATQDTEHTEHTEHTENTENGGERDSHAEINARQPEAIHQDYSATTCAGAVDLGVPLLACPAVRPRGPAPARGPHPAIRNPKSVQPRTGSREPETGSSTHNSKLVTHNSPSPSFDDLQHVLRAARRRAGVTALARAAAWGYRNPKRLDHACLWVTGFTLRQIEIAMLEEILERWTFDPQQRRYVSTPGPLLPECSALPILDLRWASFAALGSPLDAEYLSPFNDPDANCPPQPLAPADPSAQQAVRAPDPTHKYGMDDSYVLAARILPLPHPLPTRAALAAEDAERAAMNERARITRETAEARRLSAAAPSAQSQIGNSEPEASPQSENSCTACRNSHFPAATRGPGAAETAGASDTPGATDTRPRSLDRGRVSVPASGLARAEAPPPELPPTARPERRASVSS